MNPIAAIACLIFFALMLIDMGREVKNHSPKKDIEDPTDFYHED